MRYEILRMIFKIDFLTFKVMDFVFSFKTEQVREIVHMEELQAIEHYAAAVEKTGG